MTQEPPSLAEIWPLLGWYEREIMDLYGIRFRDHPEPNRLVLHEACATAAGAARLGIPRWPESPPNGTGIRTLPEVLAPDVQTLPFGPVRADVLESAEFTFLYIGEQILHYQPHLFYKHRGMEQRFQGVDVERGVILAERVSGVGTVAHALAYCQAVEACLRVHRAAARTAGCACCWRNWSACTTTCITSAISANTTTLKVGEAQGKLLEERAKQINARLTGSRFLRSLLIPGGLRRDLQPERMARARHWKHCGRKPRKYVEQLEDSESHLDRLITTGVLNAQVAFDQGATGPVQRASDTDRDLRRDHPYAAYAELPLTIPMRQEGDAYARSRVRIEEIDASIAMMQRVLLLLPDGRGPRAMSRRCRWPRAWAGPNPRAAPCSTRCISGPTGGWRG